MVEIEDDILSEVLGCKSHHKRVSGFGERAWIAEGKEIDAIYWDTGNGWCDILLVIPKNCKECKGKLIKFYNGLQKAIEKHYDEGMCRVD